MDPAGQDAANVYRARVAFATNEPRPPCYVSVPSFYRWRRELDQTPATPTFVPVSLSPDPAAPVTVKLPGGVEIQLEATADPMTLRRVLAAVLAETSGDVDRLSTSRLHILLSLLLDPDAQGPLVSSDRLAGNIEMDTNAPQLTAVRSALQEMSENDLTLKVLVKLFETLGFEKVDHHGGPYEAGKDLILWGTDELGLVELAVAQVKKWKPTARASDTRSFSEIVNQLQVASEEPVPHTDGILHRPSKVYFITPFSLDTRALQTRFAAYASLHATRCKIIDGDLLSKLVCQHLSWVVADLTGRDQALSAYNIRNLNNEVLLRSLKSSHPSTEISSFYSDLEFVVGSVTLNMASRVEISTAPFTLELTEAKWNTLRPLHEHLNDKEAFQLISGATTEIDERLKNAQNEHKRRLEEYMDAVSNMGSDTKNEHPGEEGVLRVAIDQSGLSELVLKMRNQLPCHTDCINDLMASDSEIQSSIFNAHSILETLDKIVTNKVIEPIVLFDRTSKGLLRDRQSLCIKIPFRNILAAGINVAVFGEAGAGKTTTLQMVAFRQLSESSDRIVLYLPLASVVSRCSARSEVSDTEKLESAIAMHLTSERIPVSQSDVCDLLAKRSSLLLLDGVDEAYANAPWITSSIEGFALKYPKSQVTLSARSGGEYLDQVSFIGLSLLPFTRGQRDAFIEGWFRNSKEDYKSRILLHLADNPELANIVSNPLLATTLCSLVESGTPLPQSEYDIYDERLRLLFGEYDAYKRISRITSSVKDLSSLSRKLAFALHEKGKGRCD